jgi:hypothetical protein
MRVPGFHLKKCDQGRDGELLMNFSVFRKSRMRVACARIGVAVLSLVGAALVLANSAAIPNARPLYFGLLFSTFFFQVAGTFVNLSRYIQNVKR